MYVHYQGSVSHKKWQGSRSLKFYSLPHLPPPSVMHSYPLTTPSSSGKNGHTVACASSTVRTYLHLLLGSDLSRNALTYVTYVTLTYIQYVIELAFMSGGGGVGHGLKPRWDDCQAWDHCLRPVLATKLGNFSDIMQPSLLQQNWVFSAKTWSYLNSFSVLTFIKENEVLCFT